ncbi:f5 8 type c domain-containing protein [Cystoisospora suis]|uniref:F5 8 type c domain-containing protein n=1 Tax=Cystoisospora suis TaxID=483139 RepID=A0A2C6KHI2_9APIC|nr:f5 8 type c domain-containing protein [Cystoisospora suis]
MGLRRGFCVLLPLLGVSATVGYAQEAGHKFVDSKASSTYGPEFEAIRATQAGAGYWSSSGHHSNDEEGATCEMGVFARGEANMKTPLLLLYSPTGSGSAMAFNEELLFDHPHTAKKVKIAMRRAIHDFFGINEVVPISAGEPLAMVIAGITSPEGEMCLQVEGGDYNQEGAAVVLDSCTAAFAAADGRKKSGMPFDSQELWRTNANQQFIAARSNPPKCMTLQDGNAAAIRLAVSLYLSANLTDGGNIVLVDCLHALEEADGRSSWTLEANSQLRLQKPGYFCLTQQDVHGNVPGVGDISKAFGATVTSASVADADHSPQRILDGDPSTYWASGAFGDSGAHPVNLDINLGKPPPTTRWSGNSTESRPIRKACKSLRSPHRLGVSRSVVSDKFGCPWRIGAPALHLDSCSELASNMANPSNSTLDAFAGHDATIIRLTLLQPHPKNGKVGEKYVYGIRDVEVLSNRLRSVVGDCREAANSADARDKYFVESTSSFDPEFADKMSSMDDDVVSRATALSKKARELISAIPNSRSCLAEKQEYEERIAKSMAESASIMGQYDHFMELQSSLPPTIPDLSPGSADPELFWGDILRRQVCRRFGELSC